MSRGWRGCPALDGPATEGGQFIRMSSGRRRCAGNGAARKADRYRRRLTVRQIIREAAPHVAPQPDVMSCFLFSAVRIVAIKPK